MAWVKVRNQYGQIFEVPDTVFETHYKGHSAFTIIEEPKELKIKTKVEVVEDGNNEIPNDSDNAKEVVRKSTKKTQS